jgi:hypothetical protein
MCQQFFRWDGAYLLNEAAPGASLFDRDRELGSVIGGAKRSAKSPAWRKSAETLQDLLGTKLGQIT